MKPTSSAKKGLAWLRSYLGRGKALRAEIAGAGEFNLRRQRFAESVANITADRALRADALSRFRSLGREVEQLYKSDAVVDAATLADLNRRYEELHKLHGDWAKKLHDSLGGSVIKIKIKMDPYARVLGSEGSKISSPDMFATKGMLNSMRGDRGDSVFARDMRARLAEMGPEKDVAAIRRQLRRYYLTNAATGTAGAAAVGGAGYGTYRALSGEKKAEDESDGGSALGDVGAYAVSAAAPYAVISPVSRVVNRAGTAVVDGKTVARTAVALARRRHRRFPAVSSSAGVILGLGGSLYGASGKGSTDTGTLSALSALGAAGVLPAQLYEAAAINRHLARRGIRGLGRLRALAPLGVVANVAVAPHASALLRRSIDRLRGAKNTK